MNKLEIDEMGLITGKTYIYNNDGTICWKQMIPGEFLAVKREYESEIEAIHGKSAREVDRSLIDDSRLLILLGGIKRLLFLRGYTSLIQRCDHIGDSKAVYTCTITFAPNYETRMQPVVYSDTASATFANTSGDIPQLFLEATAANRALVRCVRGFLNINIVGKDEIGPSLRSGPTTKVLKASVETAIPSSDPTQTQSTLGFDATNHLARRCHEVGLTFDQLKTGAIKHIADLKGKPTDWTTMESIDPLDAYVLIGKIDEAAKSSVKPSVKKTKTA